MRFDKMIYDQAIENTTSDRIMEKIHRRIYEGSPPEDDEETETGEISARDISTVVANPLRSTTRANLQSIAKHYPRPNKQEAENLLSDLLTGYGKIEGKFSIPHYDVAGAVAAFLAGSYMAYHNVDFPDQHFPPLVRQMRQVLSTSPDFARASTAQKQEMYEHLAILGMFMATTQMALKERPDPQLEASMRQAAKGYLEHFLQTDASRVQITRSGLVIR